MTPLALVTFVAVPLKEKSTRGLLLRGREGAIITGLRLPTHVTSPCWCRRNQKIAPGRALRRGRPVGRSSLGPKRSISPLWRRIRAATDLYHVGEPTSVAVLTVTRSEPSACDITLPCIGIGTPRQRHVRWTSFRRANGATGMMHISGDHGEGRHRCYT